MTQNRYLCRMSKVTAHYHIVFCTKRREKTIPLSFREDLYRLIWKIITNNKSKLVRIGGVENHVHILLDLNPTIALAPLMRDIKAFSSGWLSKDNRFTAFCGWADGYYASSVSPQSKLSVIEYIKNQEQHHLQKSFDDELKGLYEASGIAYDDRDMR